MIQEGIYYQKGVSPGPFFRLVCLNFRDGISTEDAKKSLLKVWSILQELKKGVVSDLKPERPDEPSYKVPTTNLTTLLGFGNRLFDSKSHNPVLVSSGLRPFQLGIGLRKGDNQPFNSLKWDKSARVEDAQCDFIFQFIANTELGVNRPIVEIHKAIEDYDLPIQIVNFHSGFQREDRRSWIDFHDGINNIRSDQREAAIVTSDVDHPWINGGTYMTFLKIKVNLSEWRKLNRIEQEIIVGRTKITGCPIDSADKVSNREYTIQPISGCPFTGEISNRPPVNFIDPPRPGDDLAIVSHIHRSNLNRGHPSQDSNNRIYRQGYEFLDSKNGYI